ncbi:glycosyltransferase family 2 protein [Elusimicrobiota bacterium]
MPSFSLVIPFFNEESAANKVIESYWHALTAKNISFEMILVNNGSSDNTRPILSGWCARHKDNMRLVDVERNQGYGWGILQGADIAQGDWISTIPGDGQLSADDLVNIFESTQNSQAKASKGCRQKRSENFLRKFQSRTYNAFFSFLFPDVSVKDINGWPKVVRREIWRTLDLISKDWFIDAEIILKLTEKNILILDIPITPQARMGGSSHVRISAIVEFMKNLVIWRLTRGSPWKKSD